MADIKTNLRELSVATTIGLLSKEAKFTLTELYDADTFFTFANQVIAEDISSAKNSCPQDKFTGELKNIIDNGYSLGKEIFYHQNFTISEDDCIKWLGNNTQKDDPVDIIVGRYGFSLKEESFILENMGLYKLLNCYTGSSYKKRHIFKDYAPCEYSKWFEVTWDEMLTYLKDHNNAWSFSNPQKQKAATIVMNINSVTFEYFQNGKLISQAVLPKTCILNTYETNTNSKIREHVFAKFINQTLSDNKPYNSAKKHCAIIASNALATELIENLDYSSGLPRFLRIHNLEYYYAKTTKSGTEIYKVPSLQTFGNDIVIESIKGSVPTSQANILTTIKNRKNGNTLVLRNECRFSHGQFNGTPEAKMYYEHGGTLLTIYEKI